MSPLCLTEVNWLIVGVLIDSLTLEDLHTALQEAVQAINHGVNTTT